MGGELPMQPQHVSSEDELAADENFVDAITGFNMHVRADEIAERATWITVPVMDSSARYNPATQAAFAIQTLRITFANWRADRLHTRADELLAKGQEE